MKMAYKFLRTGLLSDRDESPWVIGEWREVPAPTEKCKGLNASRFIQDAMRYVKGEILAKVEYRGIVIEGEDKLTCEYMRVVKTWDWTKDKSVKLAIYSARLVLPIFEQGHPKDDRPRRAIEAAEKWLKEQTEENAYAAYAAAYAAYAVYASAFSPAAAANAAYAAYAAAYAAYAAVYAADAAAYAADAAYATDAAARMADATGDKVKHKVHRAALKIAEGRKGC